MNVLSLDKVADVGCDIRYEQPARRFVMNVPGYGELYFVRRCDGLHGCDFSFLLESERTRKSNLALFQTVPERE